MEKTQRFWDNDRFINALYYIAMVALVGWYAYTKGWILANFPFVEPKDAAILIQTDQNVTVLDVRTPEEYKMGAIKGALHIPLEELEERLDELTKDTKILVYCNSGNRSITASRILQKNGFTPLNVKGGIIGLAKAKAPLYLPQDSAKIPPAPQ